MYCRSCNCEYNGWSGKCPTCKQPLQDGKPHEGLVSNGHVDYQELVNLIEKQGTAIHIDLQASQVTRKKSTRFPWMGFGYAGTQMMQGSEHDISVELTTTEVGKDRKWSFPYKGHGYAWQQEVQGSIAGNQCSLEVSEVQRSRSWSFPYSGFGYAWSEVMHGKCGDKIQLELKASKVSRKRRRRFPYFGFGFAWVQTHQLTLELV